MVTMATTDTIMAPIIAPVLLCTEIVCVICVNVTAPTISTKKEMLYSQQTLNHFISVMLR